jgi:thiamine biosynthesis lipoprotein
MKHALTFLMLFLSTLFAVSCTTTAWTNPNPDLCVLAQDEAHYKCDVTWTSYFDTTIRLTYYAAKDKPDVDEVFENIRETLWDYHRLFDKYNAYEGVVGIYAINADADIQTQSDPVRYGTKTLDPRLYDALAYGLLREDAVQDGGVSLFNVALGPVLAIWHNLREDDACDEFQVLGALVCPKPTADLFEGPFAIDPHQIVLDEDAKTVSFLVPGMRLDLGGYAKGYVAKLITDYLDSLEVPYIFNAGASNVKAGGVNPNAADGFYTVALTTPKIGLATPGEFFAVVKIASDVAIVTSGNYQRYFIGEEDRVVYHHIIDPRTYYPGGDAMAVSVLHEDGALADIYSTAVYLLGLEKGLAFVNATAGLEAIWYLEDGTIVHSDGLNQDTFTYGQSSYPLFTLK